MKKFQKIIAIVIMLAIILPIFPVGRAKAADDQAGYYGYKSRQIITDALMANTEIPEWKKIAILDQLSVDGYFWMKTKQDKLDYIHANLPNNQYLSVVADAENIHSWTVKPNDYDNVPYQVSQAQLAEFTLAINEAKAKQDFFIAAFDHATSECSSLNQRNWSNIKAITYKTCWAKTDLQALYENYWPDLRSNTSRLTFTEEEIGRLASWKAVYERKLLYGDKPAEETLDILWLLPAADIGGKLTGWIVEAAAKRAGVLLKPIVNVGSRVAARTMASGGARTVKKLAQVMEMPVKEFAQYSSRKVRVDLSYTLRNSSVNQYARKKITESIEQSVNLVAYNLRINGLADLADTFITRWNNNLLKTKIVTPDEMAFLSGSKGCLGLCDYTSGYISINENVFLIQGMTKATTTHEFIHAASAVTQDYIELHRVGLPGGRTTCPLVEGLTETITKMQTGEKIPIQNSFFAAFTRVGDEYYSMLIRRKGSKEGTKLLYQLYFRDGLDHVDEALEIPGLDQKIDSYIGSWDIDGAIQYLRSL